MGSIAGLTGASSQIPTLTYSGRLTPSNGGEKSPLVSDNNATISIPVFRSNEETYSATISGGQFHFGEAVQLDSGRETPQDFYRAEVGVGYTRRLSEKRSLGLRGAIGYSGDKFTGDTQSYNFSANYSFPSEDGKAGWVVSVMMSNLSPFGLIPIPGFFYIYKTPTLTGIFGLPVSSLQWTPTDPWSFSLSILGPQIRGEIAYGIIDKTQVFFGGGWQQQRFLVSDREKERDRLTVEDKNIEVGVRMPVTESIHSEVSVGGLFDRSVYEGEKLFDKSNGQADLDNSLVLKYSLRVIF